ncbi:hypothetical protein GSI_10696 [Ganoderma sinense ZZ0214-1]|uniref:Uncharacterized protein n=1 Tax=Ganoderma sinense ZZ0214-1 TaxID=1077348 RepID=A0A2G8S1B0_9APHY|nr:hypothetical protein GSI_10696 [Ganoderma sinense ZZ0214-1]
MAAARRGLQLGTTFLHPRVRIPLPYIMSSTANETKDKTTAEQPSTAPSQGQQPVFSILPHPAKTNDPRDLQPSQPGSGLSNNAQFGAFHARGPYVPPQNILNNLPEPEGRESLQARQEELNKK